LVEIEVSLYLAEGEGGQYLVEVKGGQYLVEVEDSQCLVEVEGDCLQLLPNTDFNFYQILTSTSTKY
jgi:hypothetical protein